MKSLEVYPTMTLAQLRYQFNDLFPHLQLEPIVTGSASIKTIEAKTIASLADPLSTGRSSAYYSFLIESDMNIVELEANFLECFGLAIRVSRWTGYAWHDTDDTSHWTLDHQNRKGSEMAQPRLQNQRYT